MPEIYDNDKELFEILERIFKGKKEEFIPGKTTIHYALAVYDHREIFAALKSLLSGWFGLGRYANEFEKKFSKFLGMKHCVLINSGFSANLLAVESLRLPRGSEDACDALGSLYDGKYFSTFGHVGTFSFYSGSGRKIKEQRRVMTSSSLWEFILRLQKTC